MTLSPVVVLVVSFFMAASAWAQETRPTAQQPVRQVGDEWTYTIVSNGLYMGKRRHMFGGTATYRHQSAFRITSRLLDVRSEKVRAFLEDSDHFYTPAGAWIGERLGPGREDYAEPPLPITLWPLEVGKRWSATVSYYLEVDNIPQVQNRFRVIAYESVTVPAGTFEAFHLEHRAFHPEYPTSGSSMDYWYAPAVKNMVKYKGVDWHSGFNYVMELVSYRVKE